MDYTLNLPGGEALPGARPVVVIGPNGSGKTRQTRQISTSVPIEFINALRNTRVAPELPAVGVDTARNNFSSQKNQTRAQHWEIASEFDYMLSQLLAQQSMAAVEFTRRFQVDPATAGTPEETPLTKVERLWGSVFPGRELHWRDWKPLIKNRSTGTEIEYSGNQMSDGEKAALYLAGRVLTAEPGVLVVDEPETHFHSLLAVRLWNSLEAERSDIRFVYVTHDLTFALSRKDAHLVLAGPTAGLRTIGVESNLPTDVTEALLGSASLSFYASRAVFCEGDAGSFDSRLYDAWFHGADTVVRPVGSCQRVLRCVDALASSGIASALSPVGVIDRDYHPDAFIGNLPAGAVALAVHEVESLFCLPEVVEATCRHIAQAFDVDRYRDELIATVSDAQGHQIIIERWKRRIEPHLEGLVAGVRHRDADVADLLQDLPTVFDHTTWSFSPADLLIEERDRVVRCLSSGSVSDLLALIPGKQLLPVAARQSGMTPATFTKLIIDGLRRSEPNLVALGAELEIALTRYLPPRAVAIKTA